MKMTDEEIEIKALKAYVRELLSELEAARRQVEVERQVADNLFAVTKEAKE